MPNLIERITGDLTIEEVLAGEKMSLHAFCASLHEQQLGYTTVQEVIDAFTLTAQQQNQVSGLVGLLNAAPSKVRFMRVFKDLMYMGEGSIFPQYQDMATVITRLENEVVDQGGTLP